MMSSFWPQELLLDELWLKSQRELHGALEGRALWLDDDSYRRVRRFHELRGQSLQNQLLQPALGPRDYGTLLSPRVFGYSGDMFRASLPIAFAFGHEITGAFHRAQGGVDASAEPCARVGSLFNVFCSLFDHLHDSNRPSAKSLSAVINSEVLAELAIYPDTWGQTRGRLQEITDPEARIVLKLLTSFYTAAAFAARVSGRTSIDSFGSVVQRAYESELASLISASPNDPRSGLERGIGLFVVLSAAAALGKPDQEVDQSEEVAVELGTAITILDDLVDLISDLKHGAANTLLFAAKAAADGGRSEPAEILVETDIITRAAIALCEHLVRVIERLDSPDLMRSGCRFRDSLLMFVRDWCG
jgi:hypothetical protein